MKSHMAAKGMPPPEWVCQRAWAAKPCLRRAGERAVAHDPAPCSRAKPLHRTPEKLALKRTSRGFITPSRPLGRRQSDCSRTWMLPHGKRLPHRKTASDWIFCVRINQDNASGRFGKKVHTRFPPEPKSYLRTSACQVRLHRPGWRRSTAGCATCASTIPIR